MTSPPIDPLCEDFFQKIGGKGKFARNNGPKDTVAKIHKNGQIVDCYPVEGPGDYGWCQVGGIFT